MNISTRQLAAFVHAARERSFTRAAERMHLSQAGLSLMMRELEAQVGCRLFDRTTRTVALTAAGASLLPIATRTLEDLASSVGSLQEREASVRNTLRVGATPLLCAWVMPAVIQALRASHPEIGLALNDAKPEEVQRRVAAGELDCGLGPFASNVPGIQRTLVYKFDLLYIRATRGVSERGTPAVRTLRWGELREAPLLQLPPDNPIQQLVGKELRKHGIPPHPAPATFNNVETVIGMAVAGAGAAIIPSVAFAMCRNNALEVARLVTPALNVGLVLISKRGRPAPAALGAFSETLVQVLRRTLTKSGGS
jgi:DNA-binding transcriptional LysR family regulator